MKFCDQNYHEIVYVFVFVERKKEIFYNISRQTKSHKIINTTLHFYIQCYSYDGLELNECALSVATKERAHPHPHTHIHNMKYEMFIN